MLINALIEKPGDADIQRAGPAGENVYPELVMEAVAHAEKRSTGSLGRTPRIGMAQDAFSGSFDAPSVSRFAGSFVLAQDDRGWVLRKPNRPTTAFPNHFPLSLASVMFNVWTLGEATHAESASAKHSSLEHARLSSRLRQLRAGTRERVGLPADFW